MLKLGTNPGLRLRVEARKAMVKLNGTPEVKVTGEVTDRRWEPKPGTPAGIKLWVI